MKTLTLRFHKLGSTFGSRWTGDIDILHPSWFMRCPTHALGRFVCPDWPEVRTALATVS